MDYGLLLLIAVLVIAVAALTSSTNERRVRRTERRLADIDTKLNALLAHHGVTPPQPDFSDVRELALTGRKIEAIKRYRDQTGADLKEAKEAVDRTLNP